MQEISQIDERWNKLYSKGDKIYLYVAPLKSTRELCKVKDWEIHIKRLNKHIFRKLNAYGFNYNLMRFLPDDTRILLKQEDKSVLRTTPKDIISKWQFLSFWMQGFEKQVFLPIKDFIPLS